jgi:hypothetical protein
LLQEPVQLIVPEVPAVKPVVPQAAVASIIL